MKLSNNVHFPFVPLLAFLTVAQFSSGCTVPPIDSKRDSAVDFSKYKTYQWVGDPEAQALKLENPKVDGMTGATKITKRPDLEPALKAAVNKELKGIGMVEISNTPDFYVTYYGKAKDDEWVSTWKGVAPSVGDVPLIMYPNFERTSSREYQDGTLLLVFYDPKTKKPAWTGTMKDVLQGPQFNLAAATASLGQLVKEFKSTA